MNISGLDADIQNPITKTEDQTPLDQNNYNKNIVPFSKPAKYKECLKNHAASIGGNATDGCGEFMPNGEEGTLESLKCSACNCHRNFHRKELEGDELMPYHSYKSRLMAHPPTLVMPLGAIHASRSDEMEAGCFQNNVFSTVKKRFRTKFSQEQKEKMLAFAEKVGWKLQRQEEVLVQEFCQEIGIKRRVLKVWMHNNKHTFAKKNCISAADGDGD